MVTYGGGHVAMVVPVATELRRRGWSVQVLALTTAEPVVRKAALPCLTMNRFMRPEDHLAKSWGERLAADIEQSHAVSRQESVAYLGLSYADLVEEVGESEAARLYAEHGRQAFKPVRLMRRIIAEIQPTIVVATNSPRAERAAIEAAVGMGIPSVCLVDLFALQEIRWIGTPGYANRLCVMSGYVREHFIAAGRAAAEVVVTGNPAFDRIGAVDVVAERTRERRRRGWGEEKVILWASQPEPTRHPFNGQPGDPSLPRRIDRALMDLVARQSNWRLVIRPHPSENLSYADLPERVSVCGQPDDLTSLLAAADCVIVCSSTVGLEAALLGRPLVQVQLSVFSPDAPYASMGVAVAVMTLDGLEAGIRRALDAPPARQSAVLPVAGKAAGRVADIVEQLAA